ncbi:hypothetical protein ANN_06638 [Periplaneta americana]|uniref:Mutator-like transposase domain-containing protein n=1 Tax=Periplaneta americana TaxID=6978 RepID=A0ABQ8TFQ0_PERAM|nr:hypothetical protein ANN_06638 [Periplaneta americana]
MYHGHIKHVNKLVTQLAYDTMNDAANEVRENTGSNECAVSLDGTWQRRGFSSLSGVVTAMSVKTGCIFFCLIFYKIKDIYAIRTYLIRWKFKVEKTSLECYSYDVMLRKDLISEVFVIEIEQRRTDLCH